MFPIFYSRATLGGFALATCLGRACCSTWDSVRSYISAFAKRQEPSNLLDSYPKSFVSRADCRGPSQKSEGDGTA
jgi:hypothetical protein